MAINIGNRNTTVSKGASKTLWETINRIINGDITLPRVNFAFTGTEQSYTAPRNGLYLLEVRGAQGGGGGNGGGHGGYSRGIINLEKLDTLKVYVGGQGNYNGGKGSVSAGGRNGGGNGGNTYYSGTSTYTGGGGGGTDIRVGGNGLYNRVIVAGGGAGGHHSQTVENGHGGGETANNGYRGATQTSGNAFGTGFSSNIASGGDRYCSNGGGGGWYGGAGSNAGSSDSWSTNFLASGGSGFVFKGGTPVSGYLVEDKYKLSEAETVTGKTTIKSPTGEDEVGHIGNGYAAITPLGTEIPTPEYVTVAGIYHNPELGVISIGDGENWITISDKNVGATSCDVTNSSSYGDVFQRGNNYGFPSAYVGYNIDVSPDKVDVSGMSGGNKFNRGTFVTKTDWMVSNNKYMWEGKGFDCIELAQGPCNIGFHIPTKDEFTNIIQMGVDIGAWEAPASDTTFPAEIIDMLKLPKAGYRKYADGDGAKAGVNGSYWFRTNDGYSANPVYTIVFEGTTRLLGKLSTGYGFSIRPFRDKALVPTKAWDVIYSDYGPILPEQYQELSYIQSTGTQYISTNIIPKDTLGIYMKLSSQDVSTDSMYIGSNDNNSDSGSKKFGIGNTGGKVYYGFNSWLPDSSVRPSTSADTIVELENNYKNSRIMKKDGSNIYNIAQTLNNNGYALNVFGHNGGGTAQYMSKIKLYRLMISDSDNVVAKFIPCYRKSDGAEGLYDLVTKTFFSNSGTGKFTRGSEIRYIPEEYQQVEYVESDGTQYIDVGYKTNRNIETKLALTQNTSYTSEYAVFGDAWAENAMFLMTYQGNFRWHFSFAGKNPVAVTGNKTEIETSNAGIKINGTMYSYSAGSTFSSNNIHLFNSGDNSNTSKWGRFKLHYFQLYDNGVMKRDFVSCYRKSDNVIGLYDLVENKFYTNAGSGTFTKGDDV